MNDTLIRDSLKLANEVIGNSSNTNNVNNFWIWIAITEFLVIIFLLFKRKTKVKETVKSKFKTDSLKGEIDFHNIIDSSFNSMKLYDELKVKCHPDRFPRWRGSVTRANRDAKTKKVKEIIFKR